MKNFDLFKQLHHQAEPLILANVWNAHTAKIIEKNGFKALATSSAALANTLGYDDGENIPFAELLFLVEKISKSTQLPLSVDIESGYGKSLSEIVDNIQKLIALGVVGINLEDSIPGENKLVEAEEYAEKIQFIKSELAKNQQSIFINARMDTFLLKINNPLAETLKRIPMYEKAGADSIFVPFICDRNDIKQVVSTTQLPINVLSMPNLPSFDELIELGVKRISMGSALYNNLNRKLIDTLQQVNLEKSTELLFKK
jgi:2-methylisocitrate lyase-like PEP mutase family enzyme